MKNGRFQAKDIDDRFFLACVDWVSWQPDPPVPWASRGSAGWTVFPHWALRWNLVCLMPMFPEEVIHAKARQLLKRGLLDGCGCGCRGDFLLTNAGRDFLAAPQAPPGSRDARIERRRQRREVARRRDRGQWVGPCVVFWKHPVSPGPTIGGCCRYPYDHSWTFGDGERVPTVAEVAYIERFSHEQADRCPDAPMRHVKAFLADELEVEPASVNWVSQPGPPTAAEALMTLTREGIFDYCDAPLKFVIMPDKDRVRDFASEMLGSPPDQTLATTSLSEDGKTLHIDASVINPSPELAERLLAMGGRWGEPVKVETKSVRLTFDHDFETSEPK